MDNVDKTLEAYKKALLKLSEYGIMQDGSTVSPGPSNGWTSITKFSIPEYSTLPDVVGEYHMNKQEDMIALYKDVFMRGLSSTYAASGKVPVGRKFEDMVKFYCRVRKGEVWTNRDKSYWEAVNLRRSNDG